MNLKMDEAWEYKPTREKIKDLKNEVVDLERQLAEANAMRDKLRETLDSAVALSREIAEALPRLSAERDDLALRLYRADYSVGKMAECYNYGAGYYNQPGFATSLLNLFVAYGFTYDQDEGTVSK